MCARQPALLNVVGDQLGDVAIVFGDEYVHVAVIIPCAIRLRRWLPRSAHRRYGGQVSGTRQRAPKTTRISP